MDSRPPTTTSRPSEDSHGDIVTTYHKHMNGTAEQGLSKKWIKILEEQILLFFAKLFGIKGFEKPLNNMNKVLETCLKSPRIKETDVIIFNVANLINQLNETLLNETLPLLANLLCVSKHEFAHVKMDDAKKLVLKFRERISCSTYTSGVLPEVRLRYIIDQVDSLRKYSEYLLRVNGYSMKIGRSPREILQTMHQVRNEQTL